MTQEQLARAKQLEVLISDHKGRLKVAEKAGKVEFYCGSTYIKPSCASISEAVYNMLVADLKTSIEKMEKEFAAL